jgi:hypothetical protein
LLERDTFDLFLPEFDKPWVIHLRKTYCCSTNLCTWRPNTVYKNRSVRRHQPSSIPLTISSPTRWKRKRIYLILVKHIIVVAIITILPINQTLNLGTFFNNERRSEVPILSRRRSGKQKRWGPIDSGKDRDNGTNGGGGG